jgi:hypothetical protein
MSRYLAIPVSLLDRGLDNRLFEIPQLMLQGALPVNLVGYGPEVQNADILWQVRDLDAIVLGQYQRSRDDVL